MTYIVRISRNSVAKAKNAKSQTLCMYDMFKQIKYRVLFLCVGYLAIKYVAIVSIHTSNEKRNTNIQFLIVSPHRTVSNERTVNK